MRVFIISAVTLMVFVFLFLKSNAWQIHQTRINKGEVEYYQTKHSIHWERLIQYIGDIPKKITHIIQPK